MLQRYKASLLVVGILVLLPMTVSAYSYSGYKWAGSGTTVDSGDSSWPSSWTTPLANAMSAWNGASSPFTFSVGSGHKFKVGSVSNSAAVAETNTTRIGTTIINALTTFNQNLNFSTTGESGKHDVRNAATHELGHWLRLLDLYGSGDTSKTMYGNFSLGETLKRTLEADDLNGINYIYP